MVQAMQPTPRWSTLRPRAAIGSTKSSTMDTARCSSSSEGRLVSILGMASTGATTIPAWWRRLRSCGDSAVIDGEAIVQDETGASDFEALGSALRWQPPEHHPLCLRPSAPRRQGSPCEEDFRYASIRVVVKGAAHFSASTYWPAGMENSAMHNPSPCLKV
jgi:hypothetical protein